MGFSFAENALKEHIVEKQQLFFRQSEVCSPKYLSLPPLCFPCSSPGWTLSAQLFLPLAALSLPSSSPLPSAFILPRSLLPAVWKGKQISSAWVFCALGGLQMMGSFGYLSTRKVCWWWALSLETQGMTQKVSISLQIIHCFPQGWVADFLKRALLYYVMKFMVYIQMLKGGLSTTKQCFYLKGNQQHERKRELMAYLQAITSVGGHWDVPYTFCMLGGHVGITSIPHRLAESNSKSSFRGWTSLPIWFTAGDRKPVSFPCSYGALSVTQAARRRKGIFLQWRTERQGQDGN